MENLIPTVSLFMKFKRGIALPSYNFIYLIEKEGKVTYIKSDGEFRTALF